ncbi:hypothetical protein NSTC745_06317 [Nostoc sp. DSM 114161]|jgi:hypothetical protein|uniref:hypothetical protein n=1 Tax=Nostoc sp. DSM 114161 TaxID=3440143 RepID=UPI004045925E
MALFRVKTDTRDFSWSSHTKEKSDKEIVQSIGRIMNKLAEAEPDSQVIEVKVVDRNW